MKKQSDSSCTAYLQPNFETDTTDYVEHWQVKNSHQPPLLFYQFKLLKTTADTLPAVPDGCLDIIFCCSGTKPDVYVYGSLLTCNFVPFTPGETYFGVRIPPGYGIKSKEFNIREMTCNKVALVDLLLETNQMMEGIVLQENFTDRINVFNSFLGKDITPTTCDHAFTEYLLQEIIASNGTVTMKQLSTSTAFSDKYIRNTFNKSIGMSPKQFSKIIRFQKSLHMLKNGNTIEDIIFKNGYYDQAHLINDFRNFGYFTPLEFITHLERMRTLQNGST